MGGTILTSPQIVAAAATTTTGHSRTNRGEGRTSRQPHSGEVTIRARPSIRRRRRLIVRSTSESVARMGGGFISALPGTERVASCFLRDILGISVIRPVSCEAAQGIRRRPDDVRGSGRRVSFSSRPSPRGVDCPRRNRHGDPRIASKVHPRQHTRGLS